jgi:hypothetical protein
MSRHSIGARILALLATLAVILIAFFTFVRPWYLQWGATAEEQSRALPGDEMVPDAVGQSTHAITIHANVDRVWPWLAQLGRDRGGFYSYDLLENLVGCEMPTEDRLRPDRQQWQLGDKLWMYPENKAGGIGFATLHTYVPGRALGFGAHATGTPPSASDNGSWSLVLEPVDSSTTRMFARGRGKPGRSLLGVAFDRAIFEPVHFVMERRMMIGIRQLAEGGTRRRMANHAAVVLWTVTFALCIVAAAGVLRSRDWTAALVGFVAAAVVFQVLTLVQPPILVAAALVLALSVLVVRPLIPHARNAP